MWLLFALICVHSFLFTILFCFIFDTGVLRTADMLDSEVSGTHFGEYSVITVVCDVTWLTLVDRQTSFQDDNAALI